uniref:NADH-ubiquinone oxidoreductase chain 6 n=1 Tax=Coraebus cavifrons TaxID=2823020 RepID=A0A8A6W502_9COLE|nr:NADH dehydrogenase subunit 6 [Coraebus cavifrons]QTK22433.1 NADH dehydrogenase subunit 6 [Coraebus cavifrons]
MLLVMASFYLSTIFMTLKHPISLGACLLMQSTLIALTTGMLNINFWFSYIMFLIMVGGMLVLFIYMTSVASNEKFKMSIMPAMVLALLITVINLLSENYNEFASIMTTNENIWKLSLIKFFTFPQSNIMVLIMSYLFLALVAVVKITSIEYGPLRPKI